FGNGTSTHLSFEESPPLLSTQCEPIACVMFPIVLVAMVLPARSFADLIGEDLVGPAFSERAARDEPIVEALLVALERRHDVRPADVEGAGGERRLDRRATDHRDRVDVEAGFFEVAFFLGNEERREVADLDRADLELGCLRAGDIPG